MSEPVVINLKDNLKNCFVAFIDVMGFSALVNNNNTSNLQDYFNRIIKELREIQSDKVEIQSLLISDSIILISPDDINGLQQLLHAIRRIQRSLLWKKILMRGAVSHGPIYLNLEKNIIVGKGFIKAYLLEKEAVFPRVIIDPSIIKLISSDKFEFLDLINGASGDNIRGRLIYSKSPISNLKEDGIFVDYATKIVSKDQISKSLNKVYQIIKDNMYSDQSLFTKYVWLRDYFLEIMKIVKMDLDSENDQAKIHRSERLAEFIQKFERL
jgi:hypothetical protein